MKWTGILLLGACSGPKASGVFEVSSSLSLIMMIPIAALEYAFLPVAGKLYGRGRSDEVQRTYQVLTKVIFSATVPIFIVLFLFAQSILTILFGSRFGDAAPVLRILSCGFLFNSLWGPNGILMVVIGMPKEITFVSIFGGLLNIVLNFVLIKFFRLGTTGAAFALAGTYVGLNILVATIIYVKTGIQPFTRAYVKTITCASLSASFIYMLFSRISFRAWLIPIYLLAYMVVYGFSMVVTTSIDIEEIAIIKALVAQLKTRKRPLVG
jgi:O-antigen/teichoic acid export membrane protein